MSSHLPYICPILQKRCVEISLNQWTSASLSISCRFTGLSTGQIFDNGCWDGERWFSGARTVLERSTQTQGHGAQVCEIFAHSWWWSFTRLSHQNSLVFYQPVQAWHRLCWTVSLPQVTLPCSGKCQTPSESTQGQSCGDAHQRTAGAEHSGEFWWNLVLLKWMYKFPFWFVKFKWKLKYINPPGPDISRHS